MFAQSAANSIGGMCGVGQLRNVEEREYGRDRCCIICPKGFLDNDRTYGKMVLK